MKATGSMWIRGLLTLVVLAIIAYKIDVGAASAALLRLRLDAALAVLALVALDRGVMIWRWLVLLRARGIQISTRSAAWIYLVSSFVGGFLPAGVGADVARAYSLTQRTARGSEAVASVAVDRLLGLLSIVVMGTIGAWVAGRQIQGLPPYVLPAVIVIVLIANLALLWSDRIIAVTAREGTIGAGVARYLINLSKALSQYRGHRAALWGVAGLSVFVQVLRILQAYLLGQGIGIDVPLSYYLLFMPIGLIALLLPISISGIGAPQGIIVWLLQPAGVPAPDALALSTLIVLSGIVANLPGAWLYLRARNKPAEGKHGVTR